MELAKTAELDSIHTRIRLMIEKKDSTIAHLHQQIQSLEQQLQTMELNMAKQQHDLMHALA